MLEKTRPLSQVVPVLVAALVCDVAAVDPTSNKHSLIGIFDKIFVAKFPTSRRVTVYMKLTDADGHYQAEVKYVRVATGQVLAAAKSEFVFEDRLASADLHIPFPPLPIPDEGRYEFQVWFNSMFLGSASIDAVPRTALQVEE